MAPWLAASRPGNKTLRFATFLCHTASRRTTLLQLQYRIRNALKHLSAAHTVDHIDVAAQTVLQSRKVIWKASK